MTTTLVLRGVVVLPVFQNAKIIEFSNGKVVATVGYILVLFGARANPLEI